MGTRTNAARTSVGIADDGGIFARGYDVTDDLIGKLGFTAYFYLLVTGEMPKAPQVKILDAFLVALGDPGLNSIHQASRIAYSSNPASLQLAMASGYLASHPKLVAEVESCVMFLKRLKQEIYEADHSAAHILKERLKAIKESRSGVPGLGSEPHVTDRLAERLLAFAEAENMAHTYVTLAKQLHFEYGRVFETRAGVSMALAIAALQLELELPAQLTRYLPWLAQTATMLAHLAEEHQRPISSVLLSAGAEAVTYENQNE